MFAFGIINITLAVVRGSAGIYYLKSYLKWDGERIGIWFLISGLSMIFGAMLTRFAVKAMGKKWAFIASLVVVALTAIPFYWIKPDQTALVFAFQILGMMFAGINATLFWALVADTADFQEWKFKTRTTGVVFSATTCAQKAGMGIGAAFAGFLIDVFRVRAQRGTNSRGHSWHPAAGEPDSRRGIAAARGLFHPLRTERTGLQNHARGPGATQGNGTGGCVGSLNRPGRRLKEKPLIHPALDRSMEKQLYLGKTPLRASQQPVQGRQVILNGERLYQIANYDRMRPFFMTVVSDADHWLFISSNGGLTAGRRDANLALFPYYTDDKIRDHGGSHRQQDAAAGAPPGPGLPLGTVLRARQRHLSRAPQSLQELLGQPTDLRGDQRGSGADLPLRLAQQPAVSASSAARG